MERDMSKVRMELAGGATVQALRESRSEVMQRAPAWWRKLSNSGLRAAAAEKYPPRHVRKTAPPIAGWTYGVAVVGVSDPALSQSDGQRLHEQFTDDCIAALVRQANSGGVSLTWGHSHDKLVTTGPALDLLFRADPIFGLTFTARLPDSPLNRRVLAELEQGVLGVSVAYDRASGWTVERRGYGPVRIVNSCRLHHVAIIGRDSGRMPCYPAARIGGRRGAGPGCPPDVRDTVRAVVCRELIRQANVMT